MLFNSVQFLVFFPLVVTVYFIIPHRLRWILLLISSCYFYMAFIPVYILILAITIIIDYFAGIWIEKSTGKRKKIYLIMSIISTCLVLFIFKYFNFFNSNFTSIAKFFHWNYPISTINVILPIGLSFHTFQSLSYVVEVFRGKQKAERHFGIYALYVMFFPQLVAGPIERPQNMLHQFYQEHKFEYQRVTDGLKLMAWGMFKKVVIADRLAIAVNQVYNNPTEYTGLSLIIATVFFAFQIYCDFSGYADIAIGAAQVMGFKLMDNFNRPYFSKSISEFWRRWHISLSTWFKDYLYISMGGNQVSVPRHYINLFITFLVSGLWHGANWTFVVWGALHGTYLIIGKISEKFRKRIVKVIKLDRIPRFYKCIQVGITFCLVTFSWIFFRANSISDALYIIKNLFVGISDAVSVRSIMESISSLGFSKSTFGIAVLSILIMEMVHLMQRKIRIRETITKLPLVVRWTLYYGVIFYILLLGIFESQQFIYFQF